MAIDLPPRSGPTLRHLYIDRIEESIAAMNACAGGVAALTEWEEVSAALNRAPPETAIRASCLFIYMRECGVRRNWPGLDSLNRTRLASQPGGTRCRVYW